MNVKETFRLTFFFFCAGEALFIFMCLFLRLQGLGSLSPSDGVIDSQNLSYYNFIFKFAAELHKFCLILYI